MRTREEIEKELNRATRLTTCSARSLTTEAQHTMLELILETLLDLREQAAEQEALRKAKLYPRSGF